MIYLASKSPRRRELLRQIGVEFEVLVLRDNGLNGPDVSEDVWPGEQPENYVERVTREKADLAAKVMEWRRLPVRPVLAADTTVAVDKQILCKPSNPQEAADMLRLLSGRTHQVMTSVALHHDNVLKQVTQISQVRFAPLTEEMIAAYCATSDPYDKAGGYGIQGPAAVFVEQITGSHSGIMGLPLREVATLLRDAGIRIL